MVNGRVVCGCFKATDNLCAPREIDNGPVIIRSAEILTSARNVIPVFVKQRTNAWEFVGHYQAVHFSRASADLKRAFARRRPDAIGVLYLEEADLAETVASDFDLDLSAVEGKRQLRVHWIRERKPSLVAAKKRIAKATHGCLICEACSLSSTSLPEAVAEACFEAHHLLPLAESEREIVTRLDEVALLCANCHRMIHAADLLLAPSALGALLRR